MERHPAPLAGRLILIAEDTAAAETLAAAVRRTEAEVRLADAEATLMACYRHAAIAGQTVDAIVFGRAVVPDDVLPATALLRAAGFAGAAIGWPAESGPYPATSWVWAACDAVLEPGRPPETLAAEITAAILARFVPS
jgi:hypothetical protein